MSTHQGLSAAEIEALEEFDDAGNPKDDDADSADDDTEGGATDQADTDEPEAEPEADEDDAEDEPEAEPEPAAEAKDEPEETAPAPTAALPAVEVPTDAKAQIDALKAELRAARVKLLDGVMEPTDFDALEAKNEEAIEALRDRIRKAEIYKEMSQAHALQQWKSEQDRAFAEFKADGLDYRDEARPGLLAAYNVHLTALGKDPKNEHRDAAWFLREAHKATMRDLGITARAAAPAPAPAPKARGVDMAKLPPTLSRVPVAAEAVVKGNEFAHLDKLTGDAYERAVAKMTPEQLERWLN